VKKGVKQVKEKKKMDIQKTGDKKKGGKGNQPFPRYGNLARGERENRDGAKSKPQERGSIIKGKTTILTLFGETKKTNWGKREKSREL